MPRRIVEPLLEACKLLFRTDVEEELQDRCAILYQNFFEVVYQIVALRPYPAFHELVHSHHEDVLVMGPIENHDFAFLGRAQVGPPEKIMSGLVLARLLEPEYERPLWIHSAEYMPNDAVLAGGIKRLQHNEKRLAAVRVKQVLQLVHAFHIGLDLRQSLLMTFVLAAVGGVNFRQPNLRTGLDH
jgi:hypothetical protein